MYAQIHTPNICTHCILQTYIHTQTYTHKHTTYRHRHNTHNTGHMYTHTQCTHTHDTHIHIQHIHTVCVPYVWR